MSLKAYNVSMKIRVFARNIYLNDFYNPFELPVGIMGNANLAQGIY